MEEDLLEQGMMSFALLGAGWVLWLLVCLSVLCIGVSLERAFVLVGASSPTKSLQASLNSFLDGGSVEVFQSQISEMDGLEARVISAGLSTWKRGVASSERAMAGTLQAEKAGLERGLALLATVGSNAPFLGLFGTVLGIIQAFHDLANHTEEASSAVMAGISEALVATAVGLLVAIPAVVLFNVFQRWVKSKLTRAESVSNLVLARLEGSDGE